MKKLIGVVLMAFVAGIVAMANVGCDSKSGTSKGGSTKMGETKTATETKSETKTEEKK